MAVNFYFREFMYHLFCAVLISGFKCKKLGLLACVYIIHTPAVLRATSSKIFQYVAFWTIRHQ